MSYRFNNARGGVTCDECDILIDEDLSYDEYKSIYRTEKAQSDPDLCWECKEKLSKCTNVR